MGSVVRKLTKPFKKVAKKLVPKEAAGIMQMAAPFVSATNPWLGGAMYGLGSLKQRGRINPLMLALSTAPGWKFTDPTSGGITGSFASLGDINLAEPNCMIGFAGPRVIRATVPDQILKEDFQKSESVLKHGFVDHIVERKDIKETITNLLSILLKKNELKTFDEESSENKESVKKVASAS